MALKCGARLREAVRRINADLRNDVLKSRRLRGN
jgi:hypothetical protein